MSAVKKRSGTEMRMQRDLDHCERIIETARRSFVDMGQALGDIRDQGLYSVEFDTFDEYVTDRWEMTSRQAYRLIAGARVAMILRPIGHIESEAAARELVPLVDNEELLTDVYAEASRRAAGGRVTAALVRAARDDLAPTVIDGEVVDEPEAAELLPPVDDPMKNFQQVEAAAAAAASTTQDSQGGEATSDNAGADGGHHPGPDSPADRDLVDSPESAAVATTGQSGIDRPSAGEASEGLSADTSGAAVPPFAEASTDAQPAGAGPLVDEPAAGGVTPAAGDPKPFEFPDVEALRKRTDLDQDAVEEYARKTEEHELALWRVAFTTALVDARKALRRFTPAEIFEKADDELRELFAELHADIEEKNIAVTALQLADEQASRANVIPLRSVS